MVLGWAGFGTALDKGHRLKNKTKAIQPVIDAKQACLKICLSACFCGFLGDNPPVWGSPGFMCRKVWPECNWVHKAMPPCGFKGLLAEAGLRYRAMNEMQAESEEHATVQENPAYKDANIHPSFHSLQMDI